MSEAVGLQEIAEHVAALLSEALGERWTIAYPGVPDPQEAWLQGPELDAAAVGVFVERVIVWLAEEPREFLVGTRSELVAHSEAIVAAVREQLAMYQANVEISERVEARANELATRLAARLGRTCRVEVWSRPTHSQASEARVLGQTIELARVFARDGEVWIGAGEEAGWERNSLELDAIVAALERAVQTLTLERLLTGQRYRVIRSIDQLREGMVVTFVGINEIDNHYAIAEFTGPEGQTLGVRGDYSTLRASPLGSAYRYLERVDG